MFKKILALMLSFIFSSAAAADFPLLYELKLKTEFSQGSYESPFIERPLESVSINGTPLENCTFVVPESDSALYSNAAETLCSELYKACGVKIAENLKAENAFIINEKLHDTDIFTVKVENGNVYFTGSEKTGISRGIVSFCDEVLLSAQGKFDFKDGYEYTKRFTNYVTYEAFGAVGDGKANDFDAIIKTHEYANTNGLSVFANESAAYYIGGADKTATIKTNTNWSTARFIIDDRNVENRSSWVFNIERTKSPVDITASIAPLSIDAQNIGTTLREKSLVVLSDSNVKRYIRKGENQNAGSSQTDVIIVDENGDISQASPLIWDFNAITSATAYPIDSETLTVKGGKFTTFANNAASEYNYYARGIRINRSNTVIDGIYHDVKKEGKTGAPYSAFINLSCCTDITVKNSTFTGRKKYSTIGSAGTKVQMGTYDIGAGTVINVNFVNCNQTNDITDIDYWGIAGTNYCKNLVYDGCAFSRFDAHQGVFNATIKNSVLGHHGIKLIGSGTALVENTIVLSDSFIDLRSDYGSTWNGDLIIRNCMFYPTEIASHIIKATNSEDHDFGYTCYLPQNIEIDGLYVNRIGFNYLFTEVNSKHKSDSYNAPYPVVAPQKIEVKNVDFLYCGKLYVSKNDVIFKTEIS